jgi:hypothetical protein
MPEYREKLWAAPWVFLSTALVIPASLLVLAPISLPAGIVTAVVLYAGCVAMLVVSSPVISVSGGVLRAGRARIDLDQVGHAEAFEGADASAERGPRLDARAWLLIRGWVQPVVRIPVIDVNDPVPYWLISSRRPRKLAAAINGSRRPAS